MCIYGASYSLSFTLLFSLSLVLSPSILSYPYINQFRTSRLVQRYILYTPYRSLTHTLHIHIIDVNPFSEPAGFVEYRSIVLHAYESNDMCLYSSSSSSASREETDQTNLPSGDVITMRTNTNEINIHLLLSNDINRLREAGKHRTNDVVSFAHPRFRS